MSEKKLLEGKCVVLGVTGGIAAYKIPNLASALVKLGAEVHVLMTRNATNFITPTTFETLTKHKCIVDTFDRNFTFEVEHISLAEKADLFMVAPATANVIAKLAHGIADDMLTTTALACEAPMYIVPAMNTHMYEKQVTQDNLAICKKYGMHIVTPATGRLACGTSGVGKMPEWDVLLEHILLEISREKFLAGKHVLVTAGPTREAIDPVRFISNHSTGKMGYAIAKTAAACGAKVTLVSGPVDLEAPLGVEVVDVVTAEEMYDAVTSRGADADIIIKSAAVADYRPVTVADEKIKKSDGEASIALERTKDILGYLGEHKRKGQFLCGFSMETEHMLENSKAKLAKKHLDLIVANNLKVEGAGFGVDTNVVTLISSEDARELPLLSKEDVAYEILKEIHSRMA
ncbi:MAG: bifunctional phosphopantothenoylcysteine decarboxylase/phosphopantothenate--cysteine ligase CoaBC [Lachnospiraceae bacterium]|nr:bifunctional phosphopantothenoylcysteine decarboxylase/phosphopantothenate--cysteine ligase CoaBC [Lachnospiraceae bacterium]